MRLATPNPIAAWPSDPLQWLLRAGAGGGIGDVEGLRATVKGLEQELGRLRVQHGMYIASGD